MSIINKIQTSTIGEAFRAEESSEALLAITGVKGALMSEKPIKVTAAILDRAYKLQKEIAKQCHSFIENKGFEKINLNLENQDFIEMQDAIFELKDHYWLAKRIENIPVDISETYSVLLVKVLDGLQSIVPRLPISISARKTRVNDFEVSRFNRSFRTIDNPMSVLDDLEQGCLSRQQVTTLIAFYPKLYELIKTSMIATATEVTMADPEFQLPYNKLKQLSVLMLSNTVPADLQALLQANFVKEDEEAAAQKKPSSSTMNLSQRTQTASQRVEQK